ncbi:hypothetical protein E2C01_073284 [Portunus trituberculatus]|uniref:Uncharacterized protein n=1 Tax=Portunus trituberculatus TaxID=210409 RepID=A0A5B7IBA8_PORTR|nr:hypothetical protein [Portunus trituberculatus]
MIVAVLCEEKEVTKGMVQGHLYEGEQFTCSTSGGNVDLPFHQVLLQFPSIQYKNIKTESVCNHS